VKTVASGDEIAAQLLRVSGCVAKPDHRLRCVEMVDCDVARFKGDRAAIGKTRGDQVFYDLVLTVDHDRFAGEVGEVQMPAAPAETQVGAVVHEALAHHARAHAVVVQNVDRAMLQNTRADACFAILARTVLDDDRLDAGAMQQMTEEQARWTRTDDSDLRAHDRSYGGGAVTSR
jgi:hypothetical protein